MCLSQGIGLLSDDFFLDFNSSVYAFILFLSVFFFDRALNQHSYVWANFLPIWMSDVYGQKGC